MNISQAPEIPIASRRLNDPSFFSIVYALIVRDVLKRYGHHNLGFFWVVAEPMLFTVGIIILWSVLGAEHGGKVEVVSFALTGYSFITMWRHIVNRSLGLLNASISLRYHRRLNQLTVAFAQAVLESIACSASFAAVYVPLWLLGFCPTIADPLYLVAGFYISAVFAFGFGLFLSGISGLSEVMHHIVPPIMYITMPFTGIMFMVDWLPPAMQNVMLWSPLVNGVEMFRAGLFPPEVKTTFSFGYLCASSFIACVVGYWVFRFSESRIEE